MNALSIKTIWSICFSVGAFNHARDIWKFGWLPYEFMPLPFNIYWTALLPLDFLAAILIWLKPRQGAWLGLMIMSSDVLINSWTVFAAGFQEMKPALALQSLFLVFVCVTFRHIAQLTLADQGEPT